ncbi:hypothetical protein SAURM35S_01745 [Streptomyces aurantiogriseus]
MGRKGCHQVTEGSSAVPRRPILRTTAIATVLAAAASGAVFTLPAQAATSCASPVYTRQFFANTTFSGTPKQTGCDAAISENWGAKAPISSLPTNNFGVRWSVTRDFGSGGPFTFTAAAQDGIRVYVDGVRKVDLWKNVSTTVKKTVDLTIAPGKHTLRVDYVNWTGNANVGFTYTPRTSAAVDKVKPLTPTGLAVAYDTATGRAKLTWAANKEMDLAGYRVYRRDLATNVETLLATTTATTHTDATLPVTGAAYAYRVFAYDKAGNQSAGTAEKSVTTADRTAPALPYDLKVTDAADGNKLVWSGVEEAESYLVYRATAVDGTYVKIGSSTGTSFYDDTAAPLLGVVGRGDRDPAVERSDIAPSLNCLAFGSVGEPLIMTILSEVSAVPSASTRVRPCTSPTSSLSKETYASIGPWARRS